MEWIYLAIGIPIVIGIAANLIGDLIKMGWARIRHGKLAIKGYWAEWAPDSKGREFSIGTIEYSWIRKRIEFNGTNYHSNGEPYCHWKTTASALDLQAGEFTYVFRSTNVGALHASATGFGVVNLQRRPDGRIVPQDGYFLYKDGRAHSVSHSMQRIDEVPESRSGNAADILQRVFPREWASLNSPAKEAPKAFKVLQREIDEAAS